MKLKQLIFGAAAAVLLGGSANAATSAPTVLHIVGSTAFRASATAAIINYLQSNGKSGKAYGAYVNGSPAGNPGDLYGGSAGLFQDEPTTAASTIVVKTFWTGSAAGLVDLATDTTTQNSFLVDSATLAEIDLGSSATNYGTIVASSLETEKVAPEASFSDSFYTSVASAVSTAPAFAGTVGTGSTTATDGPSLANLINNAPIQDAGTGDDASDTTVGVVPFAWWVGKSTTLPSVSNITQQAASALTQGGIPVSFLSGNSADQNSFFYLIGRNEDSGTRIGAFAESQQGFGGSAVQFALTYSGTTTLDGTEVIGGSSATVTGAGLFPASISLYKEPNISWNTAGHSGYYSGGDVKNTLLSANPGNIPFTSGKVSLAAGHTYGNSYFIGYLGFADGNGVSSLATNAGPGKYLSYNGVQPTVANIQNGEYTFWSYEHLYYLTAGTNAVNSNNQAVADGIADLVFSTYAPTNSAGATATSDAAENTLSPPVAGILYDSAFLANRSQEGATLGINY